jgi:hypothetical protein
MAHDEWVHVAPGTPDVALAFETHDSSLLSIERRQERLRGINNRFGARACFV